MMHTLTTNIDDLALPAQVADAETVLTVGAFDGIHIGHKALIGKMVDQARGSGRLTGLITFEPHPAAVLRPEHPFCYLTTSAEKGPLLEPLGLDVLVVLDFDLELAGMMPRSFVQRLIDRMRMRELWIGPDFALGRKRQGDPATLRRLGQELGFSTVDFPNVTQGKKRVSSSAIRELLRKGRVKKAARLLGRHYSVSGTVVAGAHRGHTLGFPTANIEVAADRVLPDYGVYATYAYLDSRRICSVTNVGVRPTFDDQACSVETYLMDFDRDIYGQVLTIAFVARLRAEERFDDIQALIAQMEHDVEQARQIL